MSNKTIIERLDMAAWKYALLFDCSTVECEKCDFNDCIYRI